MNEVENTSTLSSKVRRNDHFQQHSHKEREQMPAGSAIASGENSRRAELEKAWSSPLKEFTPDMLWELRQDFRGKQDQDQHNSENSEQNRQFIKNILTRYPDLTPAELKLCCLLRMNLSTKDMAQLLHISEKTIENQRYRLRRKFELPHGKNLTSFLLAL